MHKSNDLFETAKKYIPGGVNSPVRAFRSVGGTPFFTKRAEGPFLYTADDERLTDFVCTWGPALHGHNHPEIKEAIQVALDQGTSFGTPNPYEVEMAQLIEKIVPSVEKVRMCNSGTEATMSAIRLARGYTQKNKIIKFSGCYHGHVDSLLVQAGSGALTLGNPNSAGIPESFAKETIVIPYNDLDALTQVLEHFKDEIACVIVEPYPANCGLILPKTNFLSDLRQITNQHQSILIFDEVMTGFRVALGGVQEKEGVIPDLTAMGKIIGGGLPVGAIGGKAEIMDHFAPDGPVYQAGTLSGNPLALAAGIASLKKCMRDNPYPLLDQLGSRVKTALDETAKEKGIPLQVPQVGSMFALFFSETPVTNFTEATQSNTDLFKALFNQALSNKVYLPPSAYETCFISTAHDSEIMESAIEGLCDALKKI